MASTEKALKCSTLHTRELGLPHVDDSQSGRKRYYRLYLPRILCHGGVRRQLRAADEDSSWAELENEDHLHRHAQEDQTTVEDEYYPGHHYHVGTLPLVFLLHSFGSDSQSLSSTFAALADAYHFVLVMPEGLENSFNAGDCCGYALENDVDDVGFLTLLRTMLVSEFDFLQDNFVYGIGHNNGAFMLTHALEKDPHLFRAIVPISGYTHHVDLIRMGLGEGGNGIGMMLHHSLDDSMVRPSGCCQNPNLPKCHGDVVSDWCMSVLQIVDLWARQVNMCGDDGEGDVNGFGSYIGGRSGGMAYSLSYEGETQSTVLSLMPDTSEPDTIDTLFKTNLPMSVGYSDPEEGVICLSPTSPSCVGNSTVCLYTNREDFRRGGADFGSEFILTEQVMEFIARDACAVNDGMLETLPGNEAQGRPPKHVCACVVSGMRDHAQEYGGVFCYDPLNEDGTFMTLPSASKSNIEKPTEETTVSGNVEIPKQEAAETPDQKAEVSSTMPSGAAELPAQETAESPTKQGDEIPSATPSDAVELPEQEAAEPPLEQSNETPSATTPETAESLEMEMGESPPEQEELVAHPSSDAVEVPIQMETESITEPNETLPTAAVSSDASSPASLSEDQPTSTNAPEMPEPATSTATPESEGPNKSEPAAVEQPESNASEVTNISTEQADAESNESSSTATTIAETTSQELVQSGDNDPGPTDPAEGAESAAEPDEAAPTKDYDTDILSQVFPTPVNDESLTNENELTISLEKSGPETVISDTTEQHGHRHIMMYALLVLAMVTVLGLLLVRRKQKRSSKRKKRSSRYKDDDINSLPTNYNDDDDDDSLYQDCFRSGNPYRDYFQRYNSGMSNDSSSHYMGTVAGNETGDGIGGLEIDIGHSMQDEHCPPYHYRGDNELISRGNHKSSRGTYADIYGGLDSSEWEEHHPPYAPSVKQDSAGGNYVVDGLPAVDDYSFSKSAGSLDGDSTLQSRQSQLEESMQQLEQSQAVIPDSLMNVISTPAMYLNSGDRRMLRKYRQEQGKDKIIRKRESELEDSGPRQSSFADIAKELGLDEDLKRIEESKSNSMISLI